MKLEIKSFENGAFIPAKFAFCKPDTDTHVTFSDNLNPHLLWSEFPAETKSFAIICHDSKVPSKGDDVNQEGREVPEDLPRVDFFHWSLLNIPKNITEIKEGEVSNGVVAKGKNFGQSEFGLNGINDYTGWFAGDENMGGNYGGYDGPCPPWNDSLIHEYIFTVFALDSESVELPEIFNGNDARKAIEGKILDKAEWKGFYTLNKRLM